MSTLPVGAAAANEDLGRLLTEIRRCYAQRPEQALRDAQTCRDRAEELGDEVSKARALGLACLVALHRGEMREALALVLDADRIADVTGNLVARTELAAANATLRFMAGSLAEAIRQSDLAVAAADASGDLQLQVYARGVSTMVFGTVGVHDRLQRFEEMLGLATLAGDVYHRILALNNIACHYQEEGDQRQAERWIAQALALTAEHQGDNSFALAVVRSTHADIHLSGGRPQQALDCAEESLRLLMRQQPPHPYVFAASVRAQLQALGAIGEHDRARETGLAALARVGEQLPRARAQILTAFAQALHEAGSLEEAYDALKQAFELERQSFSELSELQQIFERASVEARVARREADRDWLTGLYNRRFLARELDRLVSERRSGTTSVAAIDLDHFKTINDRFGHSLGDRVLTQTATLIRQLTRETDIAVRSGGEEFLILMPYTDAAAADACCRRIHLTIATNDWAELATDLAVTVSIGLASGAGVELQTLVATADQKLYAAKRAGRNCVVA